MTGPTGSVRTVELLVSGTRVVGTLRAGPTGEPTPGVVLCTGFSGTQDTPSIVAAAEAFTAAGMTTLTFDYRGFGTSSGEPRQVVSIPGQLLDIRAAIAFLRARPEVDSDRVALWGSSLGGGHALTVAADDDRIGAVVAQVPFNGFPRAVEGRSKRRAYAVLWAAIRDWVRGRLGRPPLYIKAVGAPGELAVMVGDDAERTIEVLDGATWQNRVAPRGLIEMMRYRPGRTVGRVTAPILVCIGELDRMTQGVTTEPLVRDARDGRLRTYPFAHFDIYRPEIREQVLRDQVAFLDATLTAARVDP